MYFKLTEEQENKLLEEPETGMGYQIVETRKAENSYIREKFLVLNSEIVIKMDGKESENIHKIINKDIDSIKASAQYINLNIVSVYSELGFKNMASEPKAEKEKSAIENDIEFANGKEIFVRLSAFLNDKRIDTINKCLRPGSYATTLEDYYKCKNANEDFVERYALPNNDRIIAAFHIKPTTDDILQRGIVQPAYGKRGGVRKFILLEKHLKKHL